VKNKKGMKRDESSKDQVKCKDGCHVVKDESSSFPTVCTPRTRTSSVPWSHIFTFLCTCPPLYIFLSLILSHYGLILMIIGSEGERPLEEFISLIILV
jgi:hypothetical protein